MTPASQSPNLELNEEELRQWDLAWQRVASHLGALGLRNKLVLTRKVSEVMARTEERWRKDRTQSPDALAGVLIEEMVVAWLREALELGDGFPTEVSRRGRLALLLLDMPGHWQHAFLSPPPWPEDFVTALRRVYPSTGPEFRRSQMIARPLELGTVPNLANRALRGLEKVPRLRSALLVLLIFGTAAALFLLSR